MYHRRKDFTGTRRRSTQRKIVSLAGKYIPPDKVLSGGFFVPIHSLNMHEVFTLHAAAENTPPRKYIYVIQIYPCTNFEC